jgi:hypothetical protein
MIKFVTRILTIRGNSFHASSDNKIEQNPEKRQKEDDEEPEYLHQIFFEFGSDDIDHRPYPYRKYPDHDKK